MTAVVTERNEEEYTLCRDLASREASMSLSLMVSWEQPTLKWHAIDSLVQLNALYIIFLFSDSSR